VPVWLDLMRALCLFMVIEGILPFVSPARSRSVFARLSGFDDRALRTLGFLSMLAGLLALQLLHWLA
jgi:uncharacterized protein YjeT (DUF2065 family)